MKQTPNRELVPSQSTAAPAPQIPEILDPRADQIELSETLGAILETSGHAYLESPTGTGKTLTIALTGSHFPNHIKIFLANTVDLVAQAQRSFEGFARAGLIAADEWRFMTWMKYVSSVKLGTVDQTIDNRAAQLVFIDECHIGGTANAGTIEKVSFPLIRECADKTVWVSATPWNIDENVLGARDGHTASFTTAQAYDAKLVNDVDLVRIDCGLQLKVAVAELERTHGSRFSTLAERSFEIEGDEADELLDLLTEHSPDRKLQIRDVSAIVKHRYRLMADHYLQYHAPSKAIFWLPNQSYAKACAEHISGLLPNGYRAEAIITLTGGSTAETEYTDKALASFQSQDGDVAVVCAVYRLREGFDMPDLYLGYDCSWNPHNLRSSIQKIGRLTRTRPGKPRSQYHYAVDVKTVLVANSEYNEAYIQNLSDELGTTLAGARISGDAIHENGRLKRAWGIDEKTTGRIAQHKHTFNDHDYTITKTPLFEFQDVTGFVELARLSLAETLKENRDRLARFSAVLDEMDAGSAWETIDQNIRWKLTQAANPRLPHFIPEIRSRIERDYPHLAPTAKSDQRKAARETYMAMLDQLDAGIAWTAFSAKDRTRFKRSLVPGTKPFDAQIRARVQKSFPHLLPETMADKNAARINRLNAILDDLDKGQPWKSLPSQARQQLCDAANPRLRTYAPAVAQRLCRDHPNLAPVDKNTSRNSRKARIMALIDELDNGRAWLDLPPPTRLEIQYAANPKRRQFLPEAAARLSKDHPDLVPKPKAVHRDRKIEKISAYLDALDRGKNWRQFSRLERRHITDAIAKNAPSYMRAIRTRVERDHPYLLKRNVAQASTRDERQRSTKSAGNPS